MIGWVAAALVLVAALFVAAILFWPKPSTQTVHIDATRGDDTTGDGSKRRPLRSIRAGQKRFAEPGARVALQLAPGVYEPPRPDAKTIVGMMGGPEEGLGPDPRDVKDELEAQRKKIRKRSRSRRMRKGY